MRMMSIARTTNADLAIIHAARNSVRETICAAAGRNGMDSWRIIYLSVYLSILYFHF